MPNTTRVVNSTLLLFVLTGIASAQVAVGVLPFNSYGGGPLDSVNLGNLNVHLDINVINKAGRGMPFSYDLTYDSSIWTPVGSSGHQSWHPSSTWGWSHSTLGSATPYVLYSESTVSGPCQTGGFSYISYGNFVYHDQFGVAHPFGVGGIYTTSNTCPSGQGPPLGASPANSQTVTATDGSGYTMTLDELSSGGANGTLVSSNGINITAPWTTTPPSQPNSYTRVDADGNTLSFNPSNGQYTDTLGQNVLTVSGSNPVSLTYTPPNGTPVPFKVNYASYTVQTHFGCSGVVDYPATSVSLVSSVSLPDGTSYSFTYEPTQGYSGSYTGRLASVTLPTGGQISYTYPLTNNGTTNGINCADGTAPAASGSTPSMTRTLSSPGGQWTYSRTQGSGQAWTTAVTDPKSNQTVINFQEDSATGNGATYGFYETQRQVYQGSISTTACSSSVTTNCLLLTTITCWIGNTANCATTAVSSPITQRAVTLQYPNGGLQSKTVTSYNAYGLVTENDEYDYSGSTPARKTLISYASLGNNIVDRPSSVTVEDGSNNILSKTSYTYDEYSLQPTTGTPQHSSIGGSRGDPTTIFTAISWNPTTNSVSGWLTRHYKYYDTGNIYQAQDVNGQWTTYNYSTTAQGNSTQSCGNSFPTSVTLPISGLSISTTYDCIGGVVTSVTDLNGNSKTASFTDRYFWRPAATIAPYTSNTNTMTTNYTYTTTSLDSRMLFNSNMSVVEQLTKWGTLGQVNLSQQREGPSSSNWDTTAIAYDSLLRPYQSKMPCVTTSGSGCPSAATTTSTFDALGRVKKTTDGGGGWVQLTYTQNDVLQEVGPVVSGENTKQKQLEYDALGRLISVCEKTSLPGYGICAQRTSSPNGYLTKYDYGTTTINSLLYTTLTVTQNKQASSGSQTRVYTYDLTGRLVSEQNPENGTTTYTYDTDSSGTCPGTYSGDLVKRTDNKTPTPNITCYAYDPLHRVTSKTYSGPDSANTPSKTYVYDGASLNGTAMSNPKGQMVEAYTGASASKTTDEFFSYSVRGELTDTWECTPHSGTNGCASVSNYYHVTAGFWENRALKTLSSSVSGVPTQTYGVDAMGRTSAVSASSGQNPVASASYSLSTYTSSMTLGSGDSDTFNFDSNTGRMTKYTSNVGSQSDIGQMTWNPNGSLGSLQVTDTITSTTDTQTCSYTHDDLARISSVGCVNGSTNKWSQTFSYDVFGDIKKASSGPGVSFQPTYTGTESSTTPTNQYYQIGSGPTGTSNYQDANGQVTNDGVHTYTWDAEGKMLSVDTTTLTHDALGRMVEKNVSGTYTQIVYGPQGRFATMHGQTLVKAFVPLPGAQAIYTSASLGTTNKVAYYRHADHLGSSRLATTPTQTMHSSTAYAPFGEPYSQSGTTDLSFTGQDQDTISGMQDFLLRKFVPNQGRWLSPDPGGLAVVDPSNPQSWNRYAYVLNNPMAMIDPFGDDSCYTLGYYGAECSSPASSTMPGGQSGYMPGGLLNNGAGSTGFTTPNSPNEFDVLEQQNNPQGWLPGALPGPDDNLPGWHMVCQETVGLYICSPYYIPSSLVPSTAYNSQTGQGANKAGLDLSPKAIKCTLAGIGTMALDYAGFIPGEGVVHVLFGAGLGMLGTVNSAANGDTPGALGSIVGIHLSVLEPAAKKSIPVIGIVWNGAQTVRDWKKIPEDYDKCMNGG